MDTGESPLDVLSRAATMVEDLPPYDEARLSKCREDAGGKWRRTKHRKDPPEYSAHFPRIGEPIDLSTRRFRGSPPSYSQTMAIQKQSRNSVICTPNRSESSGGVCDPMIDEHFRRSLGKDYLSSANDESDTGDQSENQTDSTSLSVDDHFAKALGDNWLELQRETAEAKKKTSDENSEPRRPIST